MRPKVTVVVPVYKVEQYIERCARSLFEQTLQEMEYIFVDDCSPDNSIEILNNIIEQYPHRKKQTIILKNSQNRGLLQTRLFGFLHAKGVYLGTVDSDDWIEPDAFSTLYQKAEEKKADCVLFGYHRDFSNRSETCQRVFPYTNGKELVENVYKFPFEFFVWGVLIKNGERSKTIFNRYFNHPEWEGMTMWEDVAIMLPYYYGSEKLAYCENCFYHYNKANESSTVNNQNEAKVYQALKVVDYLRNTINSLSLNLTLHNLALGAKNPLIDIKGPEFWRREHQEANQYILQFKSIPPRLRFLLYLMAHGISFPYFWAIKLARVIK